MSYQNHFLLGHYHDVSLCWLGAATEEDLIIMEIERCLDEPPKTFASHYPQALLIAEVLKVGMAGSEIACNMK